MNGEEVISRIQRLLLTPNAEWDRINDEGADVATIYRTYILPLTGVAAGALFLGAIIGGGFAWFADLLIRAVVSVGLQCAMVYIVAHVINALASRFGAKEEFGQAFKVAAYSPTAAWVGSIALVIPSLWLVALIGWAYSLYLLFVGLPKLMKPAADKAMIYALAVIGVSIAVGAVLFFLVYRLI